MFHPPPLDFQTNTQIEQFASIQTQLEAIADRDTIVASAAVQTPVVSNEGAEDAALNTPAVQTYPNYAMPLWQKQLPTDAALPSLVGAPASPGEEENASEVLQATVAGEKPNSEHDMGVSDSAQAPTFVPLMQAPVDFNAQPVQGFRHLR